MTDVQKLQQHLDQGYIANRTKWKGSVTCYLTRLHIKNRQLGHQLIEISLCTVSWKLFYLGAK